MTRMQQKWINNRRKEQQKKVAEMNALFCRRGRGRDCTCGNCEKCRTCENSLCPAKMQKKIRQVMSFAGPYMCLYEKKG